MAIKSMIVCVIFIVIGHIFAMEQRVGLSGGVNDGQLVFDAVTASQAQPATPGSPHTVLLFLEVQTDTTFEVVLPSALPPIVQPTVFRAAQRVSLSGSGLTNESSHNGLLISAANVTIQNIEFVNFNGDGVVVDAPNVVLLDVGASGNSGNGIVQAEAATDLLINGVCVKGNGKQGIESHAIATILRAFVGDCPSEMSAVTATGNGGHGIRLFGAGSSVGDSLERCHVCNSTLDGISLEAPNIKIKNVWNGLSLDGSEGKGNGGAGVRVGFLAVSAEVRDSVIGDNAEGGIVVVGASCSIYGNWIGLDASGTTALGK